MVDLKSEDILTCLCLIVVGYFLAKMFSKRCDGFRIGGQTESNIYENLKDGDYYPASDCGKYIDDKCPAY